MPERHDRKRATMAAKLQEQTGRAVNDWVALVTAEGPEGFMATVTWLKENHSLGHFQARLVAEAVRDAS